jgi:hypothetical protein
MHYNPKGLQFSFQKGAAFTFIALEGQKNHEILQSRRYEKH